MLRTGQQKEIDNYAWRIESLQHAVVLAETKMKILQAEERRFLTQVELMNNENSPAVDQIVGLDAAQMLTAMLTTTSTGGTEVENNNFVRYGYIESKVLDHLGQNIEMVFLQSHGYPLGMFATHNDLMSPVKLTDYTRSLSFARRSPVRFNGPNYSGLIDRTGKIQRSFQNPNVGIAAPSLFNSPHATRSYRQNQVNQSRFYERAYPFGILRSDLRRFANSSQPPWLIPGSPNNLRYNQLRTDFRTNVYGRSGSDLLKSKNYLDLSGPSYVD